jgi:hypothetical protein
MTTLVFKVSGKVMAKFHPKSQFRQKGPVCPEFRFSKPAEFPTVVTHKSLTVWVCIMDHRKAKRVSYHNGILDFQSFGQSETQKLSSVHPRFCPETEISSEVDLQNSVSFKPLVRWGLISNRSKDRRVLHVFGIHLKGRIPTKQPRNWFLFRRCNMYKKWNFQQLRHLLKIITLNPLTGWGSWMNRWKPERVFFHIGNQLLVKFPL